jgi:hypothetical protein
MGVSNPGRKLEKERKGKVRKVKKGLFDIMRSYSAINILQV